MILALIPLLILIGGLSFSLLRYHLALKRYGQQIAEKLQTGSQKRIAVEQFSKDFLDLHEQVESLFQEVEDSKRILQSKLQTLDMAISNIAHDIRTPLTIASGYTQQLLKNEVRDPETLQKISLQLRIVSKRLEALLDYRRLMEGAVKPQFSEIDLSAFATQKILSYYDAFQLASINLEVDLQPQVSLVTDPDHLERIFQNLLGNVLKHGKDKARFLLKKEEGRICIEISNLVKQPIQKLENLSHRFYSENLSDTEESSGLGLYITEELLHLIGAELQLRTDGDWLRATITF
ncbi:putative histidine kinase [Streptococcus oralis]|uniref:histidine kinase n=1 Tax=Streptococcus oralis TaxID=1303 RepID=A0A139RNJ7_STROR|nr:HAMP domain-containing sensor histidine kinase [Streptococcus oralis]KXU16320.1 putative histidine kinase [Streptococcus oralis]